VLKEEHKAIVRKFKKWGFEKDSTKEDLYYTLLNMTWRNVSALNRLLYRGDLTFLEASIALKKTNKESC